MPQAMKPDQLLRTGLFCVDAEGGETRVPKRGVNQMVGGVCENLDTYHV